MLRAVLCDGPTPSVPVRGWVLGLYAGSHLVQTVRTDAAGRFEGVLPAGRYELRHLDTAVDRICISPATVRVSAGETSSLSVLVTWTPLAAIRAGGSCD